MAITLTQAAIDDALPRVRPGLDKYLVLQTRRDSCDVRRDREYRRRFNHFYRVRRGEEWQGKFYSLLERSKTKPASFADILTALHRATGRYEASFASKLLATIDPEMPVIDSIVLRNLNLKLPTGSARRLEQLAVLHRELNARFREFLTTDAGRYLVTRFRAEYPDANITEIKMLDLVLWQTRPPKAKTPRHRKPKSK